MNLADLDSNDRLSTYKDLRERGPKPKNGAKVFDFETPIESFAILKNGVIGFRSPCLFLSHSHADKPTVQKIARKLKRNGLSNGSTKPKSDLVIR